MSAPRRRAVRRARGQRRDGYTLVEVMMAIAILTASAVAIIGMQEAVIHGNIEARQLGTATSIARSSAELLRMDALNWTSTSLGSTTFNNTRFLRDVPTSATAAPTAWAPFGVTTGAPERFRDYYGNNTAVTADMVYCVQSRFAWIFPGQLLRADIRVWWTRSGPDVNHATYAGCPNIADPDGATRIRDLHFVQTSTELRYTPAPLR
jgi:prepilin-type N-terminal cleavage/methylation domain-containing protein